jgi:hypothetical protein
MVSRGSSFQSFDDLAGNVSNVNGSHTGMIALSY